MFFQTLQHFYERVPGLPFQPVPIPMYHIFAKLPWGKHYLETNENFRKRGKCSLSNGDVIYPNFVPQRQRERDSHTQTHTCHINRNGFDKVENSPGGYCPQIWDYGHVKFPKLWWFQKWFYCVSSFHFSKLTSFSLKTNSVPGTGSSVILSDSLGDRKPAEGRSYVIPRAMLFILPELKRT